MKKNRLPSVAQSDRGPDLLPSRWRSSVSGALPSRSSGLPLLEKKLSFFGPKGVTIPVAVSIYPDELYQVPRSWAEQAYPKLIHYNKLDKGGHFAAWEQPESFTDEVRSGLRSLRN